MSTEVTPGEVIGLIISAGPRKIRIYMIKTERKM